MNLIFIIAKVIISSDSDYDCLIFYTTVNHRNIDFCYCPQPYKSQSYYVKMILLDLEHIYFDMNYYRKGIKVLLNYKWL